ncbi:MAG TPA: hypothetical protein VNX00_11830 [Herbaspirillum sp.]|jgi:hypothetical protein|nr:hypothetical protein [Herbaspirillum sp.]
MNTAELEKIHAEISKLIAEAGKLNAENCEGMREVFWYPVAISIGFVSAVAGITAILIKLL